MGAGVLTVGLLGAGGIGRAGADASVAAALGSAADEFRLVLLPAEVPAGDVVLVATNGGAEEHTLALKGGTPTAEIVPGGTYTLAVGTLAAGTYAFVCTIAGHEQLGMKADLTVVGEGAGATTTTVAPTTTTIAAGATTTSVAAGVTTTVVGATTTTVAGSGTPTTVGPAGVARLSETGPDDAWRELAGGAVLLNVGYLLLSATRPARRRGRLTG